MSFRWPELLWAVLLVPLALLVWVRGERRRGQRAGAFGNPALLPNVVTARPGWRRVVPVMLSLLAATVLLLALARPVRGPGDAERIVHAGCCLARSMRGGGMAARTAVSRLSGVTCSARAW
jgi:Ca-activated chloride channel family protein